MVGKRVLVTGATGGIGHAIAMNLAKQGAIIGIHHNRPYKDVKHLIQAIQQLSPRSVPLMADLRKWSDSQQLVHRFVAEVGSIDGCLWLRGRPRQGDGWPACGCPGKRECRHGD